MSDNPVNLLPYFPTEEQPQDVPTPFEDESGLETEDLEELELTTWTLPLS